MRRANPLHHGDLQTESGFDHRNGSVWCTKTHPLSLAIVPSSIVLFSTGPYSKRPDGSSTCPPLGFQQVDVVGTGDEEDDEEDELI